MQNIQTPPSSNSSAIQFPVDCPSEHAVNPSTANQAAPEHLIAIHGALWSFIPLLYTFLPMKYEIRNEWPFETDDAKLRAFVVTSVVYILTLVATIKLKPQYPICAGMVHKICLLSFGLAIVLLMFTIDTPLGWFTLVIWVCIFAVEGLLAWKTYKQLYQPLYQEVVEFKNMVNTLVNGNTIALGTGRF